MKPNLSAARAARPLGLALAVLLIGGCGSGAASLATDRAAPFTTSAPAPPEPAAGSWSAPPAATSTPPATAASTRPVTVIGSSSGDVAAAVRSALGLFEKVPRNPNDPASGYLWGPASDTTGHLSREVAARLAALHSGGHFSDRVCAVDYFTRSQNLLEAAPTVVSAQGELGGAVTVVIRRPVTPAAPDLSVVMTRRDGVWLAIDLATGSGPSASIFAASPQC